MIRIAASWCLALALVPTGAWATSEDEGSLLDRAAWQERELQESEVLLREPAVERYVASIAMRVCPAESPPVRTSVYRHPDAFTFALPNGAIYISLGMLGRALSEAELAALIARECAVTTSEARADSREWTGSFLVLMASVGKRPMLPGLWSPSTIRGAPEPAAVRLDALTVELMLKAGYDTRAAANIFSRLARDAESLHSSHPYYHSNAAAMRRRAASLASLAADAPAGSPVDDSYRHELRPAIDSLYRSLVTFGAWDEMLYLLTTEGRSGALHGLGAYYEGEARRRRGRSGDERLAVAAFRRALADAEPEYRARGPLGRLRLAQGDRVEAAQLIKAYLEAVPGAFDRGIMDAELRTIEQAEQ